MQAITTREVAEKWGLSQRRVRELCEQGLIDGAKRHGRIWLIPQAATEPRDGRMASTLPKVEIGLWHAPMPPEKAVPRPRLLDRVAPPSNQVTYIHAGAGCGKTTLVAQYAQCRDDVVWLTLNDRDNDPFVFLQRLEHAVRAKLGVFDFHATDFIPFAGNMSFATAVISAVRRALDERSLTLILDDSQAITGDTVASLLVECVKDCPQGLTLILTSRHELWSELLRARMEGRITVLSEEDLRFSPEEAEALWGYFDGDAYQATEGWVLAVHSYRMAFSEKSALPLSKLHATKDIFRYLMVEIFGKLSSEMQRFLQRTCRLLDLEIGLCNHVLGIRNAGALLEWLCHSDLFTLRVSEGHYRYHALFRAFLEQSGKADEEETVQKALDYCFVNGDFEQASRYAMMLGNAERLQDCIRADADRLLAGGNYTTIGEYFDFLADRGARLAPGVLLAKGMYLSSIGRFLAADQCLEAGMPEAGVEDEASYIRAVTHKARILRNKVSFEESTRCIDDLIPRIAGQPPEIWYRVMIEKIYNLAMTTRLQEALSLTREMADRCSAWGDLRVRAWFERYLTAIYFFAGEAEECIREYEKSLAIPPKEQRFLKRHSVAAYAAKAYQVAGHEEKALRILAAEVEDLQNLGLYEDFCPVYLIYADVLNAKAMQQIMRGQPTDQSQYQHYLGLAAEYAKLNRTTREFAIYGRVLHLSMILFFEPKKMEKHMKEMLPLLNVVPPFFRAVALWRIGNVINRSGRDPATAREYYLRCMADCRESGCARLIGIMAGGELAGIALRNGDESTALSYAKEFIEYSEESGHRFYFQDRKLFEPVLRLALKHGIAPEFTREMLAYGGYRFPKIYVHTLGTLRVAREEDRNQVIRIRTKKARELLAYLLAHRSGVSREQLCADLWADSEADAVRVFHTRRGEIKQAFESLGAANPVQYIRGVYRLDTTEVESDLEPFLEEVDRFEREPIPARAQRVVELYGGRYLNDLEALWAEGARLRYESAYRRALAVLHLDATEGRDNSRLGLPG